MPSIYLWSMPDKRAFMRDCEDLWSSESTITPPSLKVKVWDMDFLQGK
jgi:hypothetical protein